MKEKKWVWMPHAGHLIVSNQCRFHLNTYLGNGYLVSTVGEYWPDNEYFKRFGFGEIGLNRKYETMVFRAEFQDKNECCPFAMSDPENLDFDGYNTAKDAYMGHMRICKKWSKK